MRYYRIEYNRLIDGSPIALFKETFHVISEEKISDEQVYKTLIDYLSYKSASVDIHDYNVKELSEQEFNEK